jgi:hypothetical protein
MPLIYLLAELFHRSHLLLAGTIRFGIVYILANQNYNR